MKKEEIEDFRGAGKVSFDARKDRIQKMIDEKYTLVFIYKKFRDELNISYSQFFRYAKRYCEFKDDHGRERNRSSKSTKDVSNKTTTAAQNPHKEKETKDGKKDEGRKSASISDILKSTDDLDDL